MAQTRIPRTALLAATLITTLNGCMLAAMSMLAGATRRDPPKIDNSDDYRDEEEAADQVEVKSCGKLAFTVRAVQVGSGWGSYEYSAVVRSSTPVDCAKMPKKDRFERAFAKAVANGKRDMGVNGVVVWDGTYTTLTDDNDFHVYQYATLDFYSPDFTFSNACGGADLTLVCEASGSFTVSMYNQLVHHVARADVRRKERNVELCNKLLERAVSNHSRFNDFYERSLKDDTWIPGLTYRIRTGEKLTEAQMTRTLREAGTQAQQMQRDGWCGQK